MKLKVMKNLDLSHCMFYELQIHEANFDLTQKKSLYRKIYQLSDDSIESYSIFITAM